MREPAPCATCFPAGGGVVMDFEFSERSRDIQNRLKAFIAKHIEARNDDWDKSEAGEIAYPPPFLDELKAKARQEGLWNLFLTEPVDGIEATPMSSLDYAPCAELMGRNLWSAQVFNCSAPDTGNMDLLRHFGTPEQKKAWLYPLLEGEIRSCFAMTEPDVASSDATNIRTSIRRDGNEYVINGHKWFTSNAADPRCKIMIVMGVTNPEREEPHRRHSQVLVPMDTPGVTVVRNLPVMNRLQRHGHCEVKLENVRVPVTNILGGEGEGFALSQARLGPGRIHHCMRSIGQCEVALEWMIERATSRRTFGRLLAEHGTVAEWIALSRIEIEQARLLVLKAAWLIDKYGNKAARNEVGLIKVIVPRMQVAIANRAMQVFGSRGLTNDTPLSDIWTTGRSLQIIDGPDEVHLRTIARQEVRKAERSKATAAQAAE
jgi:acyl-CoA dehydrogenase